MKVIEIRGELYAEKTPTPDARCTVCFQCAFGQSLSRCGEAIHKSPEVFGGDCQARNVVYVAAPTDKREGVTA